MKWYNLTEEQKLRNEIYEIQREAYLRRESRRARLDALRRGEGDCPLANNLQWVVLPNPSFWQRRIKKLVLWAKK